MKITECPCAKANKFVFLYMKKNNIRYALLAKTDTLNRLIILLIKRKCLLTPPAAKIFCRKSGSGLENVQRYFRT